MISKEESIQCFNRKPEGKTPVGWPRRRWEDNFTADLGEIVQGVMD
jgi:hypothetical protein